MSINIIHPHNILKQIPHTIELRLSATSSSESIFRNSCHTYKEALKKYGCNNNLTWIPNMHQITNIYRKRNIVWFNPPFSKNVSTNVGKRFLNLIDYNFPFHHILHKIFNRNSVKVSKSCMPNMKGIIS